MIFFTIYLFVGTLQQRSIHKPSLRKSTNVDSRFKRNGKR